MGPAGQEPQSQGGVVIPGRAGRRVYALKTAPMARNADERRIIELVVSGTQFGRPFTITPDTPEDRVKALRAAFHAAMADKDFLAEAGKLDFEVNPVTGEALEQVAARITGTPKDLAARARQFLE